MRTTARMLPEAAARGADPEPRKCRLRTSKRNFAGREARAYPQTVAITEGEHLLGRRRGHSVHIGAESERVRTAGHPDYPGAGQPVLRVLPGGAGRLSRRN